MIDRFNGKYLFLSNFYPCEIYYQGIIYPSVEHYYVALKCNNNQIINGKYYTINSFRNYISKLKKPATAKKVGRIIEVRSDWCNIKLNVMENGVRQKFKNIELRQQLLSTKDQVLIEGNFWHDCFWGVCNGKGENNLGKILMKIRDEIKKGY